LGAGQAGVCGEKVGCMKLQAFLGGCLLLLAQTLAAQTVTQQCPPKAPQLSNEQVQTLAKNAKSHGFLWRAEKNGSTSWLYGTIHINRVDLLIPGKQIVDAIKISDTFAPEINLLDPNLMQAMVNSTDVALNRRIIDSERAKRLIKLAAQYCVDIDLIKNFTPFFQTMQISLVGVGRLLDLHTEFGVDPVLLGMASSFQKQIVALETLASQLKAVRGQSDEEERALFDIALSDIESGKDHRQFKELIRVWESGDLQRLESYTSWCECLGTPAERALMKRLMDDRNPAMANQVVQLHNNGKKVFVAVGALHMAGPTGLPTLLRQQGFTVTPVKLTL
jgi:uncharacterized protein